MRAAAGAVYLAQTKVSTIPSARTLEERAILGIEFLVNAVVCSDDGSGAVLWRNKRKRYFFLSGVML